MATKKAQTAKVAPKATKTVKTSTGKTKTVPAKKPATKPAPKTTTKSTSTKTTKTAKHEAKKQGGIGRAIACIIGVIAAIALVVIAIIAIVNGINNKNENSLVVKTDSGEQITTEYRDFNDGGFRLKVPTSFKTMTAEEIKNEYKEDVDTKYSTVYTREDKSALMMIDTGTEAMSNDQIEKQLESMKYVLELAGETTKTNFYQNGDYNIGVLEFSNEVDNVKRNIALLFFSQNEKLVTVQFSYKTTDYDRWAKVSEFVLKSLKFNK